MLKNDSPRPAGRGIIFRLLTSSRNRNFQLLSLIFVLALSLRLIGIKHGFPFIFHADEPTIVRSALGVRFNPNPEHFDWPHLYIYLNFFVYMGFSAFRKVLVDTGLNQFVSQFLWNDELIFYLITRIVSAFFGAATVIPIFLAAKNLFNSKVGLFAALGYALLPFQILHSHYTMPDTPMVFFLAVALYFATKIFTNGALRDYLLAGLFIGFSASTKYNGGLACVMVPVFHLSGALAKKENPVNLKSLYKLVVSGLAALLGFLIGTPYALFDYSTFSRTDGPKGAFWQFTNVGSVSFAEHISQFINDITVKIADDVGYTVMAMFFMALAFCVVRCVTKKLNQESLGLMSVIGLGLFLLWYVSGFEKTRSHYYMITYPFLVIGFGFVIDQIMQIKLPNKFASTALVLILLAIPMFYALKISKTIYNNDTRVALYNFVQSELPKDSILLVDGSSLVPIAQEAKLKYYKQTVDFKMAQAGYILISGDSPDQLKEKIFLFGDPKKYSELEVVYNLSNQNRLGPNVKVLRYSL